MPIVVESLNEARKMAWQMEATLRLLAPVGHFQAQALAAKLKLPPDAPTGHPFRSAILPG